MTPGKKNAGFTLVEIIAALSILGIVGVFGTMFLVNVVKSYQWAEDNAHLAQKAQVAMTRIAVEMSYAVNVSVNTADNEINFDSKYKDGSTSIGNSIHRLGNTLRLNSDILTDRVSDFRLETPDDGYFRVILTMTGANNVPREFVTAIAGP